MSHEACVWSMPSCPDSHVASEGIILAEVHEQKSTAPISSGRRPAFASARWAARRAMRSEEHTSELQSLAYLVCRLLLEKKKKKQPILISGLTSYQSNLRATEPLS